MPAVIAGQIASDKFHMFELEPVSAAPALMPIKRPGVDYHAYKLDGYEYPEQSVNIAAVYASHALAVAAAATYNNSVGTNYAFTRGGEAYGTFKILKVERISPPKRLVTIIGDPNSNSSGFVVEAVLRVQRQS